jgi:DHA2 family multidrug resistance protein
VGVGCLQTALERGERLDLFASREIVVLSIVAVFALIAFVWHELRHEHPIVDIRILHDAQFAAALVFTFLLGGALFSTVFVFPVYVQTLLNYTAWETGMVILPGAIASGVTMAALGRFAGRTQMDLRIIVVAGAAIFGYSMWQHSLFTLHSGWSDFLPAMILRGMGLGMVFIPLNNLALGNLPPQKIQNGSGLYNLTRQLGGSVGIATSATLYVQLQQTNRGELVRHVNQFSLATSERLAHLKALVIAHGTSPVAAQAKALWLLDGAVNQQAAMLAFERLFLLFGIALLAALPLLLLMHRGRIARGEVAAH